MKLWQPAWSEAEYAARWQDCADRAAFAGPFTRAWAGRRRYVQLEAMLLSRAEHRLLFEASEALGAIFSRVTEWVQHSPPLLAALGIPAALEEWVRRGAGPFPFSAWARLDWAQDTAGRWWCLECNADTPGALPEATIWHALAGPAAGGDLALAGPAAGGDLALAAPAAVGDLVDVNAGLLPALGAVLREWLPGVAGFVTSPGHVEDWENTLLAAQARGGDRVMGGMPAITDGAVLVAGVAVDSLYRFYPGDWMERHPELLARLGAGLPCANPGRALIAQSKAFFALLTHLAETGQFLTPGERVWIRTFLPRTALAPLPAAWVGKPFWEREGTGIVLGEGEGRGLEWYAYQARVDIATLPLKIWSATGPPLVVATPVLGVYLAAGKPAGYMTRLGGPVTDRSAHIVPTLVETG